MAVLKGKWLGPVNSGPFLYCLIKITITTSNVKILIKSLIISTIIIFGTFVLRFSYPYPNPIAKACQVAITLILETGAIVPNANTYGTEADLIMYAEARGVTLTSSEALKSKLIKAMDYLQGLNYKGSLVSPGVQPLPWPRKDATIDGYAQPSNLIPYSLIRAQYQLVIEQQNGIDIMPTISGGFIKKEKVGPIETEYSESLAASNGLGPDMPLVDALLASLLNSTSKFSLTTYRV